MGRVHEERMRRWRDENTICASGRFGHITSAVVLCYGYCASADGGLEQCSGADVWWYGIPVVLAITTW